MLSIKGFNQDALWFVFYSILFLYRMLFGLLGWHCLNLSGTSGQPVASHCVAEKLLSTDLGEAGRWTHICHGKKREISSASVMTPTQMKHISWPHSDANLSDKRPADSSRRTILRGTERALMFCLVKWDWCYSGGAVGCLVGPRRPPRQFYEK